MKIDRISEYIDRFEAVMFTVNRRLSALIRECIEDEVTLDQFLTLRYISNRGACTASELSESFCVNRSAITAITTRLADKQYIHRVPDEQDRRVISLMLTDKGREIYETAAARIHDLLSPIISRFPQTEIDQFLQSFERLADIFKE